MDKWGKRIPDLIALCLLFIYLSPYIIFPGHAHFMLHDNLDSGVGWYKMITGSGLTFANNNVVFPNLFNGIPRGCMPSELDFYTLINLICSPLAAYCVLVVLQHLVAFWGMKCLITDHVFKGSYPYHSAFIALAFGLLPFWPMGEFSIAGQPFVFWAILNLINGRKIIYNWVVIILFSFSASDFVFSNLFLLPTIFLGMFVYYLYTKKWSVPAVAACFLLLGLSVISEYRLFLLQFGNVFTSQRSTYFLGQSLNWKGYLKTDFLLMFKGQYHFYSCQFPVIITLVLIAIFSIRSVKYYKLIFTMLAAVFIFSTIDNFHFWSGSTNILQKMGSLSSLQMRFKTIFPVLWFMILASTVYYLAEHKPITSLGALLLVITEVFFLFFNLSTTDFQNSAFAENAFYYTYFNNTDGGHKSFKNYFAPELFSAAKEKIGYKNETVLCLGFPSELAQYSNFHTAAAYLGYYPEEKKQQLVDVFKPELRKIKDSAKLQEVIGARKFQYYYKAENDTLKKMLNIDLDTTAIKRMNIKYVLSIKNIEDFARLHLSPLGMITNINRVFPEQLYIYRVM